MHLVLALHIRMRNEFMLRYYLNCEISFSGTNSFKQALMRVVIKVYVFKSCKGR